MAKNVDQRWEFSAPKFVDFTTLQQDDQTSCADEWFETRRESQGEIEPDVSVSRASTAPKAPKVRENPFQTGIAEP